MNHEKISEKYDNLRDSARNTPMEPGVYIWRDGESRIIYVGKARILRNRLNSYFGGSKDVKTAALIRHGRSIETIIVSNEYEALLLENTLIKQHNPKYNISLKDGKTYPVVRITAGPFPRVFSTRHIVQDGSLYFGPFANVQALNRTLAMIEKLFPLRKCRTLKKRESPCMYHHINRCLAPCCGRVEEAAYESHIERVQKLLAGENSALVLELTEQMHEAARALKFEEAADLRNVIQAVESLAENNSVEDMDPESRDYIAWALDGIFTCFSVLSMRGGRMTGHELFSSRSAAEEHESLESFIVAYYSPDRPPPPRIYLGAFSPNTALNQFFFEHFGFSPELVSPAAGEKRHLAALALARQNAQEELRRRMRERGAGPAMDELRRLLGLKNRPERIEGFDVSHLDGKYQVASLVSFKNGLPDRKNYRRFKLRTLQGQIDDFAAIKEAVQRRYSRLVREGQELPDLVLVDGGLGQVNSAAAVFEELGIDCDLAGLAKRDEELWLPKAREPIKLSRRAEALKLLQHVRDESHRFATRHNLLLRSKELYLPVLESIEGIGPKRAAALMQHYGNLERIAATEPEDLAESCRISLTAARAVRAAVRLALEDRAARKERFTASRKAPRMGPGAAALADEAFADQAFAAEDEPGYSAGGEETHIEK